MVRNRDFYEYITQEVFRDIEGVTSRPMFSGYGFYKDGVFFALLSDDTLYFKTDERSRHEYMKLGSKPFCYAKKNKKQVTMSYWELPAVILEDKSKLKKWIADAVRAKLGK